MFTYIARQSVPAPVITSSGKDKYSLQFQWYKYPPIHEYKKMILYSSFVWTAFIILTILLFPSIVTYVMYSFYESVLAGDTSHFFYSIILIGIVPHVLVFLFRLFQSAHTWRPREIRIELDENNVHIISNDKHKESYRTKDISLFQVTSSRDMHYSVDTRNQYSPLYDIVLVMHGAHAASINRNSIPLAVNSEIAGTLNDILEKLRRTR